MTIQEIEAELATYNPELIGETQGDVRAKYRYDALQNRLKKLQEQAKKN